MSTIFYNFFDYSVPNEHKSEALALRYANLVVDCGSA
jgi:hypothetical protein